MYGKHTKFIMKGDDRSHNTHHKLVALKSEHDEDDDWSLRYFATDLPYIEFNYCIKKILIIMDDVFSTERLQPNIKYS